MSEPDNFLSRWSRRKLEPSQEGGEQVTPETGPTADEKGSGAGPDASVAADAPQGQLQEPHQQQEPPFDVASLPPIESIKAGTDIRDFLKPGVPASLSHAALRRAWTSDPAIRDFIGIAENQWDFTNDSIPGFGPINPADIPRLLARIISSTKEGGEALAALGENKPDIIQPAEPEKRVAEDETVPGGQTDCAASPEQIASPHESAQEMSHRSKENDAPQKEGEADRKLDYAQVRHGHGSALPN